MANDVVLGSELGPEFEKGTLVANLVTVRVDATSLQRNAGTGALSAVPPVFDNVAKTITFPSQDGAAQQVINLSQFTTDIHLDGGTFDAATAVLTLTDNDGGTPDVVIDLSALMGSSTDAGNLMSDGSDGKPLLVAANITDLATIQNTSLFGTNLGKAFP